MYLAEMATSGGFSKLVAVKLLRGHFATDTDIVSRLKDEARLLGQLRHPAIVQADDLVELQGRLAIVMEYVPGCNLNWLLSTRNNPEPIPASVALTIIRRIAEAMEAAWSRPSTLSGEPLKVLHRDIKPSNVRITADGELKVLDFGIARAEAMDRETDTQMVRIGSVPYMAPERLLDLPVGPASDVYSLGVTFYEVAARVRYGRAGHTRAEHDTAVETRLCDLRLPDYGTAGAGVRELLARMLAWEPERRPTAGEVADRCRSLARKAPGPTLEEWSPSVVSRVAPLYADADTGELAGRLVTEQPGGGWAGVSSSTHSLRMPLAAPRSYRIASAVLVAAVVSLLVLLVVTILPQADPPPPPVPEVTTFEVQAPAPAPVVAEVGETSEEAAGTEVVPEATAAVVPPSRPAAEPAVSATRSPEPETQAEGSDVASAVSTAAPAVSAEVEVAFSSKPFGVPVVVDGVYRGKTPIRITLSSGQHTLMYDHEGGPASTTIQVAESGQEVWTFTATLGTIR